MEPVECVGVLARRLAVDSVNSATVGVTKACAAGATDGNEKAPGTLGSRELQRRCHQQSTDQLS